MFMFRYAMMFIVASFCVIPPATAQAPNTAQNTPLGAAVFSERDAVTQGNWNGRSGKLGYSLPGFETLFPAEIRLDWAPNVSTYVWEDETDDVRGAVSPVTGETRRAAACRFASQGPLEFDLDLGNTWRKVTFYFCDWDHRDRSQWIRISDSQGNLLHETGLTSFSEGELLSWRAYGKIHVRISSFGRTNAVIGAVFVDPLNTEEITESVEATTRMDASETATPRRKIVFLAGTASHGHGSHEHNAGSLYLAKILERVAPVRCVVCLNCVSGMALPDTCEDADCIVTFADGDEYHPLRGHAETLNRLAAKGCGFVFLHYATVPYQESTDGLVTTNPDYELIRDTSGGVYEHFLTVNPFLVGRFDSFTDHPVTRGVSPFDIYDEWYFHLRFAGGISTEEILLQGADSPVVPILICVPPDEAKSGPDGEYSGNAIVRGRLGMPEIVACVTQRPDGGRGFCFTGGDIHQNFMNSDYRKTLVNGILWTSGLNVPHDGFKTETPTPEELLKNQDEPAP